MGKVFQPSRAAIIIDFRTGDGRYLFLSAEPAEPRMYMIRRRLREIEKQSLAPSAFAVVLRKHLGGATLRTLTKDRGDRIVRFLFTARDEIGNMRERALIAQLTGKTANLFLLNEQGYILDTLRPPRGEGQEIGERYEPPKGGLSNLASGQTFTRGPFDSLSEALDVHYLRLEAERDFDRRASAARARVRKEITQRAKLHARLLNDLDAHGDAKEHRRIGELLLANISTAERRGTSVVVKDFYKEDVPEIEIEVDENRSLQEEAVRRFARYGKARRAAQEISVRLAKLEAELKALEEKETLIERIIKERDRAALETFNLEAEKDSTPRKPAQKSPETVPGARRYRSSDGYEILVGRAAHDNDRLTFRVARPHDLWLHAADYPGSHVVVRNPSRAEIPHRTIIEAAQLAAQFSQARNDGKVTVHYTPRKFLSKPKGVAPGLVRMSSFRSITVEPREAIARI